MVDDPHKQTIEEVARAHKQADDELAHRMAMNVLGDPGDPLAAKIDGIIPERVDRFGRVEINPDTPIRKR